MITVLNDQHTGASRQAGTTLQSRMDLGQHLLDEFRRILLSVEDETVIINGDLFDDFTIEASVLLSVYDTISSFLDISHLHRIVLVVANHEWHPRADKVSSFHTLAHILKGQYGEAGKVQIVDFSDGLTQVADLVWSIPHQANQDVFNIQLDRATNTDVKGTGSVLLLHANYDNHFATQSDHSLNVSEDQAKALIEAGWTLVFAHEHQARTALGGKVIVVGNQTSSSISDCLGNDFKQYLRILGPDQFEFVKTEDTKSICQMIDWTQVGQDTIRDDAKFIRVTGKATSEQAADAVNVVAGIRKVSNVFVVSNSITIEGIQDFDNLSDATFEDVSKVDVLDLLLSEFDENEQSIIKGLLRD